MIIRKINFALVVISVGFFLITSINKARGAPNYYLALNEQNLECVAVVEDECRSCDFSTEWTIDDQATECPQGYAQINADQYCYPKKDQYCCTAQHSGIAGDCEDLIFNHDNEQCAFVEDINNCPDMPSGWTQADDQGNISTDKLCPLSYQWLQDHQSCDAGATPTSITPSPTPPSPTPPSPTPTPPPPPPGQGPRCGSPFLIPTANQSNTFSQTEFSLLQDSFLCYEGSPEDLTFTDGVGWTWICK
ncbi:MAG: hypothetical protein GF332_00815 [Candidatus Moranbacteria bacterium]|nr:hypothetical protein [Candidatus Moranbacteria bacterium]